jgi:hypothetical protein
MRLAFSIVAAVLLVIVFFVALGVSIAFWQDLPLLMAGHEVVVRFVGSFIAVAAALALLVLGITGAPAERVYTLALPVLAGALLYVPNWGAALALGVVAAAIAGKEIAARCCSKGGTPASS